MTPPRCPDCGGTTKKHCPPTNACNWFVCAAKTSCGFGVALAGSATFLRWKTTRTSV